MAKINPKSKVNLSPKTYLASVNVLLKLLHPIRYYLLTCLILSAVGAAAGLLPYIAIAEISQLAITSENILFISSDIWLWTIIGVIGCSLRLILIFFSSRIGHYADAKILYDIRSKLIHHLGILSIGWFKNVGSGLIKKVMTSDLEDMHQLIAHSLGEITGAITVIIVSICYLAYIDLRLTLVTITLLLAWSLFFKISMRSMSYHLNRLTDAEKRISTASIEYANGITIVKTFGSREKVLQRFVDAVQEHANALQVWVSETRYSSAISRLLGSEMAVMGVVMIAGIWFIYNGSITSEKLLPFLIVGIGLPTSIVPAVLGSQGLRKGRVAAGTIDKILSLPGLPEACGSQSPNDYRIEFDNVSFSYDGITDAISNINITCNQGTITALVGPSGSGKTTLASLIPRFYDTTMGTIRIGGIDIRNIPTPKLLSSIALVFQDVILLRDTIRENIRVGRLDATDDEIYQAAQAAQIDSVITRLPKGYDTILGTDGVGLSGGEQQRITIARAILSKSPIVILDEAAASLDPDSENDVQQALTKLSRGRTLLVIAHRLHTISSADQIIVLNQGKIVEHGTHSTLMELNGLYADMWNIQQKGVSI